MDLVTILHDYGWAAVALVVVVERFFPVFATRIFPGLQRKAQAEQERQKMELEAKIAADKEEREHRHRMENQSVEALRTQTTILNEIKEFMVSINDRLGGVEYALRPQAQKARKKTRRGG